MQEVAQRTNSKSIFDMPNDYFAELYVAGSLAKAGWNVYFPHRDKGFDFIISKLIDDKRWVIRPVQVKSKSPETTATRAAYGYIGELSARHPDMVLAIPYFTRVCAGKPVCIAYMPELSILPHARGFQCRPARLENSQVSARPECMHFFDDAGIAAMEEESWGKI